MTPSPPGPDDHAHRLVDTAELAELGYTVVRGFLTGAECNRARTAIDGAFGPEPTEKVPHELAGFASQTGSSGFFHSVCHPHPATTCLVGAVPKMARAHCEVLRSDLAHIRLNGYSLIRTDPFGGDASSVRPHTNPTNMHIDNAFLPAHDAATPREVYSRSIVYLNDVAEGGAPIVVWPRAHKAAAEVVQQLRADGAAAGAGEYHGVRWRDEVIAAMAHHRPGADPEASYDTRQIDWPGVGPATEVLMGEGDMVVFEPMSMHSASRCVNGVPRYCWVASFFDDRVQALPHKLYQDEFHPDFLAQLAPELAPLVDWLPPYMAAYGDQVLGPETQFWAYNARTPGVGVEAVGQERQEKMHASAKQAAAQEASRLALVEQAAANQKRAVAAGAKL
jgi:hypothetical protein